jgi:hypothetical protein
MILAFADKLLYKAKDLGRNNVAADTYWGVLQGFTNKHNNQNKHIEQMTVIMDNANIRSEALNDCLNKG